jgi:RNA polymerase sigma-70 factor, ECF subfamily
MHNQKTKEVDFMALYNPVHARFERFCKARVYGDMFYKDLMHDTVIVAYERLHTLKRKEAFLYFLFGIAIRILSNNHRKKKAELLDEKSAFYLEDETARADKSDDVELLYMGLSKLPDEQREALILFEISGFNIAEIADLQQAGISAVKQRLARGRKELLEILSTEFAATTNTLNV